MCDKVSPLAHIQVHGLSSRLVFESRLSRTQNQNQSHKMKLLLSLSLGLLSASLCSVAFSADIDAGATVSQGCVMCHGQNGISHLPGIPSLAGQP
eukprot:gene20653-40496_t